MIRSTICAGTAGLLSMMMIMPAALAEAPRQASEILIVERERPETYPKPKLSSGAAVEDVLKIAENHPNAYVGEAWISELLEEPSLTPKQHARILYARAQHRWKKSSNRIGAWQDFTRFTELYPDDIYANNAGIEAEYVQIEIGRIEARMAELQPLSLWFEDSWLLGKRDEAAGQYQRSGLVPEPHEVELLLAAGYVCSEGRSQGSSDYQRVIPSDPNLYWCQ